MTICNQYEKLIQISTDMTGIGSLIREIDVKIQKFKNGFPPFFQ